MSFDNQGKMNIDSLIIRAEPARYSSFVNAKETLRIWYPDEFDLTRPLAGLKAARSD